MIIPYHIHCYVYKKNDIFNEKTINSIDSDYHNRQKDYKFKALFTVNLSRGAFCEMKIFVQKSRRAKNFILGI
jgi:hypothetical protein